MFSKLNDAACLINRFYKKLYEDPMWFERVLEQDLAKLFQEMMMEKGRKGYPLFIKEISCYPCLQ